MESLEEETKKKANSSYYSLGGTPLSALIESTDFKEMKIEHPFDVARLTELTIKKIFKPKFSL